MDASLVFHSMHSPAVLAKRKPAGTYVMPERDALDRDFVALGAGFEAEGLYDPDHWWIAVEFCRAAAWFAAMLFVALHQAPLLAGIFLAGFWHQSGVMMHDLMHNQFWGRRRLDQLVGQFFGGCVRPRPPSPRPP